MPELPEVETIRLQLEKYIKNSVIKSVDVLNPKYDINKEKILDTRILGVRRFAKVLSIDFDNDLSILIHVKMTGQLIYKGNRLKEHGISSKIIGGLGGKHTHLIFHLNDGDLYYNDVRKFGWIKIAKSSEIEIEKKLIPEPLKDLTLEYFKNLLNKSKRNIKVLLMDQSKIGGIGNIYANDALYLARINPKKTSNMLTEDDQVKLYNAIEFVLREGLKYGGASEFAFVTPDGKEGEYQNHTLVYGHSSEICKNCNKNKIEKFFLGGRGTYWCTMCQK